MKIRVWAEYLTPNEALKKNVIKLLKRYDVTLGMAFPPGSMNKDFAKMFREYEQAGVAVQVWPLLSDDSGYWPNERNAGEFTVCVNSIYDWADKNKFSIPWLAVDLELPFYQAEVLKNSIGSMVFFRKLIEYYRGNRNHGRFYDSSAIYAKIIEDMHARGVKVLTAASNLVVDDIKAGTIGFQDAMETPISTVNWDTVSVMIYTSMLAGYFKQVFSRAGACRYLYTTMADLKELLWDRAGVSIGVTYIGKLGDEPHYETPQEMLQDMQAAKAAAIEDIAIYNLEGILRSPKPEEWFETLINCEARVPEPDFRADAFRRITNIAAMFI